LQLLCIIGVVNRISRRASRLVAVISDTVFDFDIVFAAVTATFLAVIDQSSNCMPIYWFGLIAVVNYGFVLCPTHTAQNSHSGLERGSGS